MQLCLEVFLLNLDLVVWVPHILTLDRCQVDILTNIIFSIADSEGSQFCLTLKVLLCYLTFYYKGAYFNFLLDLLLGLILNFCDDFLRFNWLNWLFVKVVGPLRYKLELVTLVNSLQYL